MSKKLVEEAIGRPKEEQTVINMAKNLFGEIEKQKNSIIYHEKEIEKDKECVVELEKELNMLRNEEYSLERADFYKTGFRVVFNKKKE